MAIPRILFVFGTRPEAIKLCPVILCCRNWAHRFQARVCVTAQHRTLLDQVLEAFGVAPDYDLDLMTPGQTLAQTTARVVAGLEPVIARERPDWVIVQGDTTTTFCGALAAFYAGVPVGHVEAGLRTWNLQHPFPEEMNRLLTSRLTALHFAPTRWAADNLLREGVAPERVVVTGNPGIDAVLHVQRRLETAELRGLDMPGLDGARKWIVVTAHRRESFGEGFERICRALAELSEREDVEVIYPVHPNPNVREPVERLLSGRRRVHLLEPLNYVAFVDLMRKAYLLLTDSGGIQEEGPSLGKPILVMRETTERPEAVEAGTARLVGTRTERIVAEVARLLDEPEAYAAMTRVHNPYGDGKASGRILAAIDSFHSKNSSHISTQSGL
mgnify:CR=1 FL=1